MHQITHLCEKAIAMHSNVCYHHGVKRKGTQMCACFPDVGGDLVCIRLVGKLIIPRFHSYINQKSRKGVKIIEYYQLLRQTSGNNDQQIC